MRIVLLLLTFIFLAACQSNDSASFDESRAAAVAAIAVAADKGHAWNVTDQLLVDADEAAADGDESQAIQLADEARKQAELAAIQADHEAATWQDNVITE